MKHFILSVFIMVSFYTMGQDLSPYIKVGESKTSIKVATKEVIQVLTHYTWPGNVRELENACKRALVFANNNTLAPSDFQLAPSQTEPTLNEKEHIEQVLTKYNGVIKHTATELGLSRQALYRRIEKYQIDVESLC